MSRFLFEVGVDRTDAEQPQSSLRIDDDSIYRSPDGVRSFRRGLALIENGFWEDRVSESLADAKNPTRLAA